MSAWECEQGVAAGSWLPEWAAFGAADTVPARSSELAIWVGEQEAVRTFKLALSMGVALEFDSVMVYLGALQDNCSTANGMKLWRIKCFPV